MTLGAVNGRSHQARFSKGEAFVETFDFISDLVCNGRVAAAVMTSFTLLLAGCVMVALSTRIIT